MATSAREIGLARPSLQAGWAIFASRPVSLVSALILAVVLSVVSLGILALPAIPAYYGAVRSSRRERFFIDFEVIVEALTSVVRGIGRYFLPGFVVGILGPVLAAGLLLIPVVVFDRSPTAAAIALQLLFLPACFWMGAVLLHAYPLLVEKGGSAGALSHALSEGLRRPLKPLVVGLIVLFPITAAAFHLLMVLSYPILVASIEAEATDVASVMAEREATAPRVMSRAFYAMMLILLAAGVFAGVRFFGGVGAVFWLGLWLAFAVLCLQGSLGVAVRLFGLAIGLTAVMLGGGTIISRLWGEAAAVPWIAIWILLLVPLWRVVLPPNQERLRKRTR